MASKWQSLHYANVCLQEASMLDKHQLHELYKWLPCFRDMNNGCYCIRFQPLTHQLSHLRGISRSQVQVQILP
ncbi:hypothetical protein FRX31_016310 [Thalictrum thalictroides]|uniref:Uncharacterized protein n=1 Tax=Thalictrum thalictroides TaxID=46969 RepID=A0A7J6W9J4_THATH|nr:hypothetical protein FRX31_016310 [Thalictrum thalictroides]